PDQIYCWDISYLPTEVRGSYFYLYLFVDLFSRKIVGWQVYDSESAERASQLLTDICARQRIAPQQLTVHSDNGSPMKGETMLAMMQRLGVAASRSRPGREQRQPVLRGLVADVEIPATTAGQADAKPAARAPLGDAARALVQPRAPAQRHRLRDASAAPCRGRPVDAARTGQGL
ncbi:MAG: DDE-type integrase/transposase/recombinase, partial [Burkholderiaceae bacterium]